MSRIPVTVLTGFLGSGKTTLLNYILSAQHGQRIAVIENEFGEIGIDHELVIRSEEEIFEMNNGCICCTVRGDLIRILTQLMKRRDRFDRILIETTGLADPGPVAQTFFMDDALGSHLQLDGVVALIDARHLEQQLENSPEASAQVAFADVLLLNKIDLVTPEQLKAVEGRVRRMNSQAKILRCEKARVPLETILQVGGFDLKRALEINSQFLEPEYPFEWGGLFQLFDGKLSLTLQPGPDPAMKLAFVPTQHEDMLQLAEEGVRVFAEDPTPLEPGQAPVGPGLYELQLEAGGTFCFQAANGRRFGMLTEHHPDEFEGRFEGGNPEQVHEYRPDHEHDDEVSSVGVSITGSLDQSRFRDWLSQLLREKGPDIYRMKGVVSLEGLPERYIFQGVHMLFDGQPDRPWGDEARATQMIFIGRNLDRAELTRGIQACLN